MATEIWTATWVFYLQGGIEYKVYRVVTKRIPVKFHVNDTSCYKCAIRDLLKTSSSAKFINSLQNDPDTGLKKFKIEYTKFISYTNE